MTRIRTDGIISENPFDPCHQCAFLDRDFCFQLIREKQTADKRRFNVPGLHRLDAGSLPAGLRQ